jgi:hypothetical protein
MQVDGDTVINAIVCKKISRNIMHANGTYESLSLPLFTYIEDNKVYLLLNGQFYILYDFSANVGDSWISRNPWEYFNYLPMPEDDTLTMYSVDSVRFVSYNGVIVKQLYVSSSSDWYFAGYISERIGCLHFMLPGKWLEWDPPVEGNVRCYFDEEISYTSFIPCDTLITGVSGEKNKSYSISVYPNPFTDKIYIQSDEKVETIELYNLYGEQISVRLWDTENVKLVVEPKNLPSGFYLIKVESLTNKLKYKILKKLNELIKKKECS